MKYKVLYIIAEGTIIGNKRVILCVRLNANIGQILTDKDLGGVDIYWRYSRKEWNAINEEFKRVDGKL